MSLRIHAICLALNEEPFIDELLKTLYPFCSGISILSQYDRDWYGSPVHPDATAQKVLQFPDPSGKIHFVVRRWRDEAAARNSEILTVSSDPSQGILSHGVSIKDIREFHTAPDYYLIVDADEFYDVDTFPAILDYLKLKLPRGMRVLGYNYLRTWNRRIPPNVVNFRQFGFLKSKILFENRRIVTWNESRLSKVLKTLHLPDMSSKIYGFIDCPEHIGVFHHGCWLGDNTRLVGKFSRSSHRFDSWVIHDSAQLNDLSTVFVPMNELPRNIREGHWPSSFFDD